MIETINRITIPYAYMTRTENMSVTYKQTQEGANHRPRTADAVQNVLTREIATRIQKLIS